MEEIVFINFMSLFFRSMADIYLAVIFTRSISLRGLLGDFAELHKPPQDTDKPPLIKTEATVWEHLQHTHQFRTPASLSATT